MLALLNEFSDVFATVGEPLGQTDIVQHSIHNKGLPIRQTLDVYQNP